MTAIILPAKWQRPPSGLVEVDRSHWAGQFLELPSAYAAQAGVFGFAGYAPIFMEPAFVRGEQFSRNTSGASIIGPATAPVADTSQNTFIVRQRANATYVTHGTVAACFFGYEDVSNYKVYLRHNQGGGLVNYDWYMPTGLAFDGTTTNAYGSINTVALVNSGSTNTGYLNGGPAAGTAASRSPGVGINSQALNIADKFDLAYAYHFAGLAMSAEQIADMHYAPFQHLREYRRVLYFDVGGGGVTGTLSVTLENFTSSINGTTTIVGTIAQTMAAFTSAITGTSEVPGTIAATTEAAVGALEGTVGTDGPTGTITGLVEDSTASMAGSTSIVGTMNVTLEENTSSITGTTTVVGQMAASIADFVSFIYGTSGLQTATNRLLALIGVGK